MYPPPKPRKKRNAGKKKRPTGSVVRNLLFEFNLSDREERGSRNTQRNLLSQIESVFEEAFKDQGTPRSCAQEHAMATKKFSK